MVDLLYESSTRTKLVVSKSNSAYQSCVCSDVELPLDPHLLSVDKRNLQQNDKIYVLDSIKSGTGERSTIKGVYAELLKPLLSDVLGIVHEYISTVNILLVGEFACRLKGEASEDTTVTVVIIGGDTTVNEFINAFTGVGLRQVRLVIFPAGTGNALALSLGINDSIDAARFLIRVLLDDCNENCIPLQMYQATFPKGSYRIYPDGTEKSLEKPILFLVVTSWAFHASLVADSDEQELRKEGLKRFQIAAQRNLEWRQAYNGTVTINRPNKDLSTNDQLLVHDGPFAYFVVTPAQKFEPKFEILPSGDIRDSSLYAIGFKTEDSGDYIMDIMNQVYSGGKHTTNSKVFYDLVEKDMSLVLQIHDNPLLKNRRFCVDGAIIVVPNTEESISIKHFGSSKNCCDLTVLGELTRHTACFEHVC